MSGRSKAAVMLTAAYLLLALAAAALPLFAKEGDSLANIYFIVFAMPWSLVLMGLTDKFGIDSFVFNYIFLLIGIFINSALLYWIVTAFNRWWSVRTGTQSGKF
jgi:hypothetical protein